jgi:hypothetical protein
MIGFIFKQIWNVSVFHHLHICLLSLLSSVPEVIFPRVEQSEHEFVSSPSSQVEAKMCGALLSFPLYAYMSWCLDTGTTLLTAFSIT